MLVSILFCIVNPPLTCTETQARAWWPKTCPVFVPFGINIILHSKSPSHLYENLVQFSRKCPLGTKIVPILSRILSTIATEDSHVRKRNIQPLCAPPAARAPAAGPRGGRRGGRGANLTLRRSATHAGGRSARSSVDVSVEYGCAADRHSTVLLLRCCSDSHARTERADQPCIAGVASATCGDDGYSIGVAAACKGFCPRHCHRHAAVCRTGGCAGAL